MHSNCSNKRQTHLTINITIETNRPTKVSSQLVNVSISQRAMWCSTFNVIFAYIRWWHLQSSMLKWQFSLSMLYVEFLTLSYTNSYSSFFFFFTLHFQTCQLHIWCHCQQKKQKLCKVLFDLRCKFLPTTMMLQWHVIYIIGYKLFVEAFIGTTLLTRMIQ